ncbi:MAG: MFS transporter [Pseudomonadota bacterium]
MHIYTILVIQLFNHTCFRGSKILLTLFALELGASTVTAGVLFATYSILPTLLSVFAGRSADRIGFKLPMLLGSGGLALGMLIPWWVPTLPALFISATVCGGSYIFYTVSVQNLVGTLEEGEGRTRNYSLYALCVGVTALLGPVAAGFSLEFLGGPQTYLLMAALPLIPIAMLLMRPALRARRGAVGAGRHSTLDLLRNRPLRRMLMSAGIIETGNELGNFLLPIYGDSVGLSPSSIGLVMGALAAAMFVVRAALPMLARRAGEATVLVGSLMVAAGACLLFPFVTTTGPLLAVAFLFGLGLGCGAPLSMSLVFSRSPEGRSGEAMGLRQTVNKGTEVVVPMVFGTVSAAAGMLAVFWMVAALLALGAWFIRADLRA